MRYAKNTLAIFLLLLVFDWIQPSVLVYAFIPTNQSINIEFGRSHEHITADAITKFDQQVFGVTELTLDMVSAANVINFANVETDSDQTSAWKHVDGESFPLAQNKLLDLITGIRTELQHNNFDVSTAQIKLGQALHTIQDFYAHSNWVELGFRSPNPDLARPGHTINPLANGTTCFSFCVSGPFPLTCPNCDGNLITGQITSGYYGGESPPFDSKPEGKCSHGGPTDSTARGIYGEGINKDTTTCTFSPHDNLHGIAADLAEAASIQFLRDLKDQITPRQLNLLLGSYTLTIVIDTTLDPPLLDTIKNSLIQFVKELVGRPFAPSKYVLVDFNDVTFQTFQSISTTDPGAFITAVKLLQTRLEGRGTGVFSMEAMLRALNGTGDGGRLFLFTKDLPIHPDRSNDVQFFALRYGIEIYIVQIEFDPERPQFPGGLPPDPNYMSVARSSGGEFYFFRHNEIASVPAVLNFGVTGKNPLIWIKAPPNVICKFCDIPVDSGMTSLHLSVSGTNSVIIKRPDGTTVLPTDPGVSLAVLNNVVLGSISNPAPGSWSVIDNRQVTKADNTKTNAAEESDTLSLIASAESSLFLSSFKFVELGGRPGHEGFFRIPGYPVVGQKSSVNAVLSQGFSNVQFELRTPEGSVLQTLNLTQGSGGSVPVNQFFGDVTLPNTPFLVYVTGQDRNDKAFQRVWPVTTMPQSVKVIAPMSQDLRPGLTTIYVFQVTNLGLPDAFIVTASDDKSFISSINRTNFTLKTNETVNVSVHLQPPIDVLPGTSDALTFIAQNEAGSTNNFAVVTSSVAVAPIVVNTMVSFEPLKSTFKTISDPTGCPADFVGKFSFNARLTDKSSSPSLSNLVVDAKTLTNGNLLQNADGEPGGAGATLTIPFKDGLLDGVLSADEFVDVPFVICLRQQMPFNFFVDVLGQ